MIWKTEWRGCKQKYISCDSEDNSSVRTSSGKNYFAGRYLNSKSFECDCARDRITIDIFHIFYVVYTALRLTLFESCMHTLHAILEFYDTQTPCVFQLVKKSKLVSTFEVQYFQSKNNSLSEFCRFIFFSPIFEFVRECQCVLNVQTGVGK